MTDSSKKVEVRFGAFACTIEGYDDPVAQMREVLGMMQRMISETPALAEAAEFNADDVKDALKEGDSTPGVVVIRSADTPGEATPSPDADASEGNTKDVVEDTSDVQDATVVADSPVSDAVDAASNVADDTTDALADAATSVVDDASDAAEEVVADTAASMVDGASDTAEEIVADVQDDVADATDSLTDATKDAAAFAEQKLSDIVPESSDADQSTSDETSGTDGLLSGAATAAAALGAGAIASKVLSGDTSEPPADTPAEPEQPAASSTAAWLAERRAAAAEEVSVPVTDDTATDITVEDGLSDFQDAIEEAAEVEPDLEPVLSEPASVSPEPETVVSEPQIAESEITHSETGAADDTAEDVPFNIFAAPPSPDPVEPLIQTARSAPDVEDIAFDEVQDQSSETVIEASAVQVEPEPADETPAEITAEAVPASVNIFAPESEPEPVVEPQAEPTPEPEVVVEAAPAATADPVNIFAAAPQSDNVVEPQPEPTPEPEVIAEVVDTPTADPVNIFAQPEDINAGVSAYTAPLNAEPVDAPIEAPAFQDTATTSDPAPVQPPEPEAPSTDFNIFADPAAADAEPVVTAEPLEALQEEVQPEPETIATPEPEPEPQPEKRTSAFSALLKRVQSGAMMSAPGEAQEPEPAPAASEPPTDISAADFVGKIQATQVSDMLAGSAAWLTLVQNKAKFTRREVMEVFDTIPGDHPKTLEARIKGFGKLVRSGTLILIDDGIFAMAQNERDRFQQHLN